MITKRGDTNLENDRFWWTVSALVEEIADPDPFGRIMRKPEPAPAPSEIRDLSPDGLGETTARGQPSTGNDAPNAGGSDGAIRSTNIATLSANAMLSARDLAATYGILERLSTVETALRRLRKDRPDCFRETEGKRRNEPKYLYRLSDVEERMQILASDVQSDGRTA